MSCAIGFVAATVCLTCPFTHNGVSDNQGRAFFFCFGLVKCHTDCIRVVTVNFDNIPSPCFIFFTGIFNGYIFSLGRKLDVVGIIEHDEIVQTECSGNTSGTLRNFFLNTTVRNIRVNGFIHHFFKTSFHKFGSDGCTYSECMPLS